MIEAARAKLDGDRWDYLVGGAESEITLRRNRAAFDRLALRPRILRGATERDTATTYLGTELTFPVLLAPVGSVGRYHPDGAVACARVAERLGILTDRVTAADPVPPSD